MTVSAQNILPGAGPSIQSRGPLRRASRKTIVAWLFILPITIFHIVVVVIPVFSSLYYALTDWSGMGKATYIGLRNFQKLFFEDAVFRMAFANNWRYMGFYLTLPFAVALLVAALMAQVRRGAGFFRAAIYLPNVLPAVAYLFVWQQMLSPMYGVGAQLERWGVPGFNIPWLGRTDTALPAVALIGMWGFWGFLMVLFLSAMQAIPVDLYDAAKIDGANRWQEFLNVTLPGIRPTVFFMLMNTSATIFSAFTTVYILTEGGPAYRTELLATYLFRMAFRQNQMGYATAIGVTVALLAAAIIGLFQLLRRRGWEV